MVVLRQRRQAQAFCSHSIGSAMTMWLTLWLPWAPTAAADEDDEPWEVTSNWGTNRGSDWVHIAAPGADLVAPRLKGPGDTRCELCRRALRRSLPCLCCSARGLRSSGLQWAQLVG